MCHFCKANLGEAWVAVLFNGVERHYHILCYEAKKEDILNEKYGIDTSQKMRHLQTVFKFD